MRFGNSLDYFGLDESFMVGKVAETPLLERVSRHPPSIVIEVHLGAFWRVAREFEFCDTKPR